MIIDALQYVEQGMSVIPIRPRDKKPLVTWETYQNLRASVETVRQWWMQWPTANIGIVTGKISGIIVVDCDSTEGLKTINTYIRSTLIGKIPTVSTGNGVHLYFKHPQSQFINNRGGVFTNVDVRGDGGYVIAPPSVHPSGRRYAWSSFVKIKDAPEVPIELLTQILSSPSQTKTDAPKRKTSTVVWETYAASSDPTKPPYRVRLMSSGYWNCTCLRFVKGHHLCKHIEEKRLARERKTV